MKTATLISCAVLLGGACAAPFKESPREAFQRRQARRAKTSLPLAVNHASMQDYVSLAQNKTAKINDVEYDSNWSGAIVSDNGVNYVTATMNVPSAGGQSGAGSSGWVGIDGASQNCQNILQTGVDWVVQDDGSVQYAAWYEWLPAVSTDFNIQINEGDQVTMTVSANSASGATGGYATITDQTTGQTVTQQFSDQPALQCQQYAEWIVEDFTQGDSLIAMASFSDITFSGASYNSDSGNGLGVSGAQIADIEQNGQVITNCGTSGSNTVQCSYQG